MNAHCIYFKVKIRQQCGVYLFKIVCFITQVLSSKQGFHSVELRRAATQVLLAILSLPMHFPDMLVKEVSRGGLVFLFVKLGWTSFLDFFFTLYKCGVDSERRLIS